MLITPQLIISGNTTSQTEAPKQRRYMSLFVNCSSLTTLKHAGRDVHVSTVCLQISSCIGLHAVTENLSPLNLHHGWRTVWNTWRDFLPPTTSVALLFWLHISLLTDDSQASCQWPHCPTETSVAIGLGSGVRWKAEASLLGTQYFKFAHEFFFFFNMRSLAVV